MTVQSYKDRREAELAAESLRTLGLQVALLHAPLKDEESVRRVWQVVIPRDQAREAGLEPPAEQTASATAE